MAKWNTILLGEIQTRSVEKVLLPLVSQVNTLVGNRIKESEDRTPLIADVLANLELSICKFTSIGHEMGNVNDDIKDDMSEACDTTNKACNAIVSILNNSDNETKNKESLTNAAWSLLSAITQILILADKTAVKKMVSSLAKVEIRLNDLESVLNFTEFVTAFSQFGSDMVELAFISGERQNDLKNDLQRAEVCASRAILEKSTMMLLTTCKTCLRHPESPLALGNRTSVFKCMKNAMKLLKDIFDDNKFPDSNISHGISLDFKDLEECIDKSLLNGCDFDMVDSLCERLDNIVIDMADVINVEQIDQTIKKKIKAGILQIKEDYKQLRSYLSKEKVIGDPNELKQLLIRIDGDTKGIINDLKEASCTQISSIPSEPSYKETLIVLKEAALTGELKQVEQNGEQLEVHLRNIFEVSKLVKNSCESRACIITASRIEENLLNLLPQLIDAGKMLAGHPSSKITQENFEVFVNVWDTQLDELFALLRNITQGTATNKSAEWLTIYIPMASKLSS